MPDTTNEGWVRPIAITVFVAIAVLTALDVMADLVEGASAGHLALELAVGALGLVGAAVVSRDLLRSRRSILRARMENARLSEQLQRTTEDAARARDEAQRWRDEARGLVAGLGEAIDRQFARWELTPAEAEVALLLLKGLSHREVAAARDVSEMTARQQARAIYRKAGVAGKHELVAFFLEDLILPSNAR